MLKGLLFNGTGMNRFEVVELRVSGEDTRLSHAMFEMIAQRGQK